MDIALTEDAVLGGRVRLLQPRQGYRVSVDAVLLAAAITPAAGERVLDLGAGAGAVGLCLAARVPGCHVVGVELQPLFADLAARNATRNAMNDRVRTIVHDLANDLPADLGTFDHVVTNPPYLAAAVADPSPDPSKALATVESTANLARWLDVGTRALKSEGTITLIHRLDRLEEIAGNLVRLGWGDIAVKTLPPAARVLVRARRAAQPKLVQSKPLVLHQADGAYTLEAEAILRHAEALSF
jgi:tRNA1(Val) A37 N6-methylase TrmN6